MFFPVSKEATSEWARAKMKKDRAYFFSVVDTEDNALCSDLHNTIGWDSVDELDTYTMKSVTSFLDQHTSVGSAFSDGKDTIILTFSKKLGLMEFGTILVNALPLKDYIQKGIPKGYMSMSLQYSLIDPTVDDMCALLGNNFKLALGEYAREFEGYVK